jgi:surface antigen
MGISPWKEVLAATAAAVTLLLSTPLPAGAALGSNDYPYRGSVNRLDPWGFYTGYCTSFAAWRLSQAGISFHGASFTGPNGTRAFFGNAGSWDIAASSAGFAVDAIPAVGAVAVWHGGEAGAWWGGHVGYVMAVASDGRAVIEEYNWTVRFAYGQRVTRAPRYIHFGSAPAPAPAQLTQPAPSPLPVFHVTATLRQRGGPGTGFASVGVLAIGAAVQVACQTRGGSVRGSSVWDRLANGAYVSDYYVDTPAFNAFSPGIPVC